MPCALVGSRHGNLRSARASHPSSLPTFPRGPPSRASCLSLGQLEPCQPPPYNEDFLAARSAHPGWAGRGVNTAVRGWTHPTQARLSSGHVPAAASAERGRAGLWKGAGREGLRASLLVSDLSPERGRAGRRLSGPGSRPHRACTDGAAKAHRGTALHSKE